jgi:hypothetical protein
LVDTSLCQRGYNLSGVKSSYAHLRDAVRLDNEPILSRQSMNEFFGCWPGEKRYNDRCTVHPPINMIGEYRLSIAKKGLAACGFTCPACPQGSMRGFPDLIDTADHRLSIATIAVPPENDL